MSIPMPSHAMVLAAGLGQRMRPLTEKCPKPLLPVGGRTMLDWTLDHLAAAGVKKIIINTHWLADQITAHVEARLKSYPVPRLFLSHEPYLLDTGGGVAKALPFLGETPFFVAAGDFPWQDGPIAALKRLAAAFEEKTMDALLLLAPRDQVLGLRGDGDFAQDEDGRLSRTGRAKPYAYHYLSLQIVHPRLFAGRKRGEAAQAFSFNELWNEAEAKGRLYGLVHDGTCYHVGTPQDWAAANASLKTPQGWRVA